MSAVPTQRQRRARSKAIHYPSFSTARSHLKDLLDAAAEGVPASVSRGDTRAVVVDAARLACLLRGSRPAGTQVVNEQGYWAAILPDTPLAGQGDSFQESITDLVQVLRDYAEDWAARLRHAPNHADQWALVQLVELSDDEQLRGWLLAES